MAKQAHDLGVRKRRLGQKPIDRSRLEWLRAKRRHPGPLPPNIRDFGDWLKSGRPRYVRGVKA